jgi:hypothetical protein
MKATQAKKNKMRQGCLKKSSRRYLGTGLKRLPER